MFTMSQFSAFKTLKGKIKVILLMSNYLKQLTSNLKPSLRGLFSRAEEKLEKK